MPDPKLFSGFSIPVTTRIEESQFKELREIVAKTVNILAKDGKALKFSLTNIDSSNVTELNTNITNISSEDGETVINGPLLEMYDDTPTLRLKMGFDEDTSTFIFSLKDDSGSETIGVDSNGNAVFKGKVEIGSTFPIVIEDDSNLGKISFYDDDDNIVGSIFYIDATSSMSIGGGAGVDVDIASGSNLSLTAASDLELAVVGNIKLNGGTLPSGSFTSADGKTVTVVKGLITAIA